MQGGCLFCFAEEHLECRRMIQLLDGAHLLLWQRQFKDRLEILYAFI
jgi:hypothetical protein